jgi:hypothetical protein
LLARLARLDVLVVDDWAMAPTPDHEIGAQKRPEDWRRSPVDGHENEPGGGKDADYASNDMRVRSRVETDQRGKNYQSEQDAGDDPHERLLSWLRHLHHTGACLGDLGEGSSGATNSPFGDGSITSPCCTW